MDHKKVYCRAKKLRASVNYILREQTTYRDQTEKVNEMTKTKLMNSCTKPRGLVRDKFLNKDEYEAHVI